MATTHDDVLADRAGRGLRGFLIGLGALALLVLVYFLGGALWVHEIDDDPAFGASTTVPEGASRAVAVAADLIDREVNQNWWTANGTSRSGLTKTGLVLSRERKRTTRQGRFCGGWPTPSCG